MPSIPVGHRSCEALLVGECSVHHHPGKSREQPQDGAIRIDVKLFERALRSYPDLFQRAPGASFEQHFLSLLMAAESDAGQTHAVGK